MLVSRQMRCLAAALSSARKSPWRLAGGFDTLGFEGLATDRSDVSGTGYWSPFDEAYRLDLLERALGSAPALPRVLGPHDVAGRTASGIPLGPGAGDNAAAALGRPILSGPSRKSFLKAAIGDVPAPARVWGTAAAVTAAVLAGAHIVRVHDVVEMTQVVRVADAIRGRA